MTSFSQVVLGRRGFDTPLPHLPVKAALLASSTAYFEGRGQKQTKALVQIGERPLLWHAVTRLAHLGCHNVAVALGYEWEKVEQCVHEEPYWHLDAHQGEGVPHGSPRQISCALNLVDTGWYPNSGGRIHALRPYVGDGTFILAPVDVLANVDLADLLRFHRAHGRHASVVAVRPHARLGRLQLSGSEVTRHADQLAVDEGWIDGGVYVLEPAVFDYIHGDEVWEQGPLQRLAERCELMAYKHFSFWHGLDTVRDRQELEALWAAGNAPWRGWEEAPSPCNEASCGSW